ncbi:MAG: hypothetical protein A2583_12370 [Bdellovibrionales bacterium RIFOXYD1_FULL_53_11]|nr:MAG: hypothetical protein A2583_12370 [Bdellovibrionales bacterium RIFOXYD1_FULL_53_11]
MDETPSEKMVIGIAEYNEAKRLQAALKEKNILVELIANPGTCSTRGCRITVEIEAFRADIEAIGQHVQSERERLYAGLEPDPQLHNQVFDTNHESAVCPACGASFKTSMKECPDCGLVLVQEDLQE